MTRDALPKILDAEPHTLVKHRILRFYLDAWLPILTQQGSKLRKGQSREVLFIDGFAGPGKYAGGEPGSPVIAVQAAIQHQLKFPIPVRMLFIELDPERFKHLQTVLAPLLEKASTSQNIRAVEPRQGDCDTVLNEMLDDFHERKITFGPALAFLDQFGYGEVSMDLISRIMSFGQCEVFTYLNYKDMYRWMSDPDKASAMNRAFGGEEWRECIGLAERQARDGLLTRYKNALKDKKRGKAKYVVSFLMFDKQDRPLYWLLFCTNSLHGLREMKKAMWRVDDTGEFQFSDRDNPDQLKLLSEAFNDEWLAEQLETRLAGMTLTVGAIDEFVLVETPCYLFKRALGRLEKAGRVEPVDPPATRRRGEYPDASLKMKFAERGLFRS
jgi:three-Cys-motif partner protein